MSEVAPMTGRRKMASWFRSRDFSAESTTPQRSGSPSGGPAELEIRVRVTIAATTLNIRATDAKAGPTDAEAMANVNALVALLARDDVFDSAFREVMRQTAAALYAGVAGKTRYLERLTATDPTEWERWFAKARKTADSGVAYNMACTMAILDQDFTKAVLPQLRTALSDPVYKKRAADDPTLVSVAGQDEFKKLIAAVKRTAYWELPPFDAYKSALVDGGVSQPRKLADITTRRAQAEMAAYLKIQPPQLTRLIGLGKFVGRLEDANPSASFDLGVELAGRIIAEGIESRGELARRWPLDKEPADELTPDSGFGAFVAEMAKDLNVTVDYRVMRTWLATAVAT